MKRVRLVRRSASICLVLHRQEPAKTADREGPQRQRSRRRLSPSRAAVSNVRITHLHVKRVVYELPSSIRATSSPSTAPRSRCEEKEERKLAWRPFEDEKLDALLVDSLLDLLLRTLRMSGGVSAM